MRDAQIIIPLRDSQGLLATSRINNAILRLVTAFGGCTQFDGGLGFWTDPQGDLETEPVQSLTVAYAPGPTGNWNISEDLITQIACQLALDMDQQAVYVRLDRHVSIYNRKTIEAVARTQD